MLKYVAPGDYKSHGYDDVYADMANDMANERNLPKDVPAGDRDRQREIAERAGQHDPAVEIDKQEAEKAKHSDKNH